MDSTPQHVYASNLLRRQSFGYPLRNPRAKDKFDLEGFPQIGDVGYVDSYGEFNVVFNVMSPPRELQGQALNFHLTQPVAKLAFNPDTIFMAGVERNKVAGRPRAIADYEFTTTGKEGAILILPNGAILSELQDAEELQKIRQHAAKYALQWCRFAKQNSLYLVTATYRSKSWTLGSFHGGSANKEILVNRPCDCKDTLYKWVYQFNVDHQQGPGDNSHVNQTVLIKGFKMSVAWDWFSVVERAERNEGWFAYFFTSLWSVIWQQWLSPVAINYIPFRNMSQPQHPLDIINRVLLEKNPGAKVAITHDDDWIKMLERGLLIEYLMQEKQLGEFVAQEHIWALDSEQEVIYLQNNLEDASGVREMAPKSSLQRGDKPQFAIINMRLESADIDHIYAGVCVLVQFGCTTRRMKNKPHASVVQWDDEIILPSDGSISVTVCGVFQLGSTLGTRSIFAGQTINTEDLCGCTHMIKFSIGEAEFCSSLLITLAQHSLRSESLSDHEEESDFMKKTNFGFEALYSYHEDPKQEYLERALGFFQCALEQHGLDHTCRATALFNFATSQLIRCQAHGTNSDLHVAIELCRDALKLRDCNHPDRRATLLLLAQALLSRLGQEYDESIAMEIQHLLAEIFPDDSRDRRTADAITRTCRLYRAVNSEDPNEVVDLVSLRDLDPDAYTLPYGYYDRPRLLHKLAIAFWVRFQHDTDFGGLDKSIALNQEALRLAPTGHHDLGSIVACLGKSYLALLEMLGGLTDIDASADFGEFGNCVVEALDNMSYSLSSEKLREHIALMSAADAALQYVIQEVLTPHTPEVQSLIDEWSSEDSIPMRCKKQLGILLSFLGAEGETKMRELLGEIDWPFKEHAIHRTAQVLQGYMPHLQDLFATKFEIAIASTISICSSADDALAVMDVDTSVDLVELGERVVQLLDNMSYELLSEELREQVGLMSTIDATLQQVLREVPLPYTPEIQSLIHEWNDEDGIRAKCKRRLRILLSFLGNESETKMHNPLVKVVWQKCKIKETVQVLRGYMPYFQDSLASKLEIAIASTVLVSNSAEDVLAAATKFKLPRFHILRLICDALEGNGRVTEAIACFRQMKNELGEDTSFDNERNDWDLDFQGRCRERLEKLGDVEMDAKNYNEAEEHFTTILLALDPADPVTILLKRGRARVMMASWDKALSDANKAIKLDPSSRQGHEMRHAALRAVGHRSLEEPHLTDDNISIKPFPRFLADMWNKIKRDSSAPTLNISENDAVVFVVGPTGSGKSWFVKEATRSDLIKVSRDHRLWTGKIPAIRCELTNAAERDVQVVENIVFIDTPPFLTGCNDLGAHKELRAWFDRVIYKPRYVGVVYMHRIDTNPALQPIKAHLREFTRILPRISNVGSPMRLLVVISHDETLSTIHGSRITEHTANLRTQVDELRQSTGVWQPSIYHEHFHGEPEVAWRAVEELFKN